MDLFNNQEIAQYIPIPIQDGEALLVENFLSSREAEHLFHNLRKQVTWRRQIIKIYGKVHPAPRESAWFGDKVGWHSDDDKEFGVDPAIASLSLGATRRFDIRHKPDRTKSFHINLNTGSLLIMKGAMQQHWEHQVPQQKHINGERINLTFRKIIVM